MVVAPGFQGSSGLGMGGWGCVDSSRGFNAGLNYSAPSVLAQVVGLESGGRGGGVGDKRGECIFDGDSAEGEIVIPSRESERILGHAA